MKQFVLTWVEADEAEGTFITTMRTLLRLVEDILNDGGAILSIVPYKEGQN